MQTTSSTPLDSEENMNKIPTFRPFVPRPLNPSVPSYWPVPPTNQGGLSNTRILPPGPSLARLGPFIEDFLPPPRPGDVPFVYHIPYQSRPGALPPSMSPISKLVLGITPTAGFYSALNNTPGPVIGFLHRPFNLDRQRLPRACTVLASHKGFDEVLTVGYNIALAHKLGVHVQGSVCLQGYKGDPERRIGVIGRLGVEGEEVDAFDLRTKIRAEFGGAECEGEFGFSSSSTTATSELEEGGVPLDPVPVRDEARRVSALAIMNAFHPAEVERVVSAAISAGFIASESEADRILYLTGAVREEGLTAARDKGMRVTCVGHRICEEWGVRFLANEVRKEFPEMHVEEVYEEEEVVGWPPKRKSEYTGSRQVMPNKPVTDKITEG